MRTPLVSLGWNIRRSCPAANRRGLACAVSLCIFGSASILTLVGDLSSQLASRNWPKVIGRVAGDAETPWYEYTAAGVRSTGRQSTIAPGWVFLHRMPAAGSPVEVSYCPTAPEVSTIAPGLSADMLVFPAVVAWLICLPGLRGLARNVRYWLVRRSRQIDRRSPSRTT